MSAWADNAKSARETATGLRPVSFNVTLSSALTIPFAEVAEILGGASDRSRPAKRRTYGALVLATLSPATTPRAIASPSTAHPSAFSLVPRIADLPLAPAHPPHGLP